MHHLPPLTIGKHTARIPIVQGGMSVGISLSGLAAAVAREGGIGVIGCAGIGSTEPDVHTDYNTANKRALVKQIKTARENAGGGVLGVNIMMALSDYDLLIQTAMEEGIDIIFLGTGLLLRMPPSIDLDLIKSGKTSIVPIISSGAGVKILFTYWSRFYQMVPDAVVIEGPLAGGHLGFTLDQLGDPHYRLENILPEVLKEVAPFEEQYHKKIPVIVGGGIFTGGDIYRFLKRGASGVQMATRFVATVECDASPAFKQSYVDCGYNDVVIIDSPVGMPGRAINNKFLQDVKAGGKKPFKCGWKCLRTCEFETSPYCIALALVNARDGKLDNGFAFCGANAYRINEIVSVHDLVEILISEYEEVYHEIN